MRLTLWEPQGGLGPEIISDTLGLVGMNVATAAVERWTDLERLLAYDCAMRHHLRASDNPVRLRPWPSFVRDADRRQRAGYNPDWP